MIDFSFPLVELEYFLLILVRVSCFIYTAPFFSMNNTPGRVKIIISCFISFLLYGVITPHVYPEYTSVMGYAGLVLSEATVGLMLGLSANLCTMVLSFAGHLVDMEIGFAMASQMDPLTKQSVTITGMLYQYVFILIMIISGMYHYLLRAISDTFTLIPVGAANFIINDMYNALLKFMSNYIIIGFRIALPVFCTILITNGILGVMAKVSPQMNMFAVGMQIKVLAGLGVLFLSASLMPSAAGFIFEQTKIMLVSFIEAMGGGA